MTCKIVKTEYFTIDIDDRTHAIDHVGMLTVEVDKKLSEKRLAKLRKIIGKGMFHTTEWGVVYCLEDGRWYRVNGKHTSILLADPTFTWDPKKVEIVITYVSWQCDTKEEVAEIYASYDQAFSNRSYGDINKAYAANVVTLKGAAGRTINACVSGISSAKFGMNYHSQLDQEERAAGLSLEHVFCGFVRSLMEMQPVPMPTMFKRYGIVTAIYQTYQEDPVGAGIFWEKVFKGSGSKTPDRRLNTFIITTKTAAIAATNVRLKNEIITQKCLKEWDAWWGKYSKGKSKTIKTLRARAFKLRAAREEMNHMSGKELKSRLGIAAKK